jgi:hypothetical protein
MRKSLSYVFPILAILASFVLVTSSPKETQAAPAVATGPVSQTWYFAEGRVGGGFVQWLTIGNPNASDCTVNIQYNYTLDRGGSDSKKVQIHVDRMSRHTQYVNNDLGITQFNLNGATLSAIVSTSDCTGITAERPMYFSNFHNVSSGTDVFGATAPANTWYFAEVPRSSAGESFLAILNPNSTDAIVTVSYYVGGATPLAETKTVPANSRGTFFPDGLVTTHQHLAVKVVSTNNEPIVVERPTYYSSVNGVSGSADVMGIAAPQPQWIFAAGTTAEGSHEDIVISNVNGASDTAVTIELLSATGNTSGPLLLGVIPVNGQIIYDVSTNNSFTGHTDDVAAIVTGFTNHTSTPADILVQRVIYNSYNGSNKNSPNWSIQGVSDSSGVPSVGGKPDIATPDASTFLLPQSYSFAEGFTSVDFNEWMMLANPTDTDESISIQFINMLGETDTATVPVPAHSRYSFNATSFVENSHTFSLTDVEAYAVSAIVTGDGPFMAERVMYWKSFDTQGTSAVPGFALPVVVPTATVSPVAAPA